MAGNVFGAWTWIVVAAIALAALAVGVPIAVIKTLACRSRLRVRGRSSEYIASCAHEALAPDAGPRTFSDSPARKQPPQTES